MAVYNQHHDQHIGYELWQITTKKQIHTLVVSVCRWCCNPHVLTRWVARTNAGSAYLEGLALWAAMWRFQDPDVATFVSVERLQEMRPYQEIIRFIDGDSC